jgi:filamentous hemagglutinin family protein
LLALSISMPAGAQVATDGSLGTGRLLNGPNVLIPAHLGRTAGANLFHSFSAFNVGRGESAFFTELAGISNVFARVTGGGRSEIFGTIRVEGNVANLYLINPAGFLFGAGASLNVPAAFHATSSNGLRFADGARFSAQVADGVTLTASAPAAFVFDGPAGAIAVSGATLGVRNGQSLSLVGGDVSLERGTGSGLLNAPAGTISVIATRGAGDVPLAGGMPVAGVAGMGRVTFGANSRVNVAEPANATTGSGRIFIRGGEVVLEGTRLDANTRNGNGGAIEVEARGTLAVRASDVLALTVGAGNAGSIKLAAENVVVEGGSLVDASCDPGCTSGAGGPVDVAASRSIVISGPSDHPTNVISNSFGGGVAGRVTLAAPRVEVLDAAFVQSVGLAAGDSHGIGVRAESMLIAGGAQLAASSRGSGRGGAIDLDVQALTVRGFRAEAGTGALLRSGVFANAEGSGNAGAITVRGRDVEVLAGGEISSSAAVRSTGRGGAVDLVLTGRLLVSGTSEAGRSAIVANTFGPGPGGTISVRADSVSIAAGAAIQSQSESTGAAGEIAVEARALTLESGGAISSRAGAAGNGGNIRLRVGETLRLDGANTGIFAETEGSPASGRGGAGGVIDIEAGRLELASGAVVFASSKGSGAGGDITVRVGELDIAAGSRLVSEATGTGSTAGIAGDIDVSAQRIALAGEITTRANLSDGGNVRVAAAETAIMRNGRITTAVGTGQGDGGNIEVSTPLLVMLDAVANANAFGGRGGNIHIGAPAFILSPRSVLTASSQLGIDGTISLESPALDVSAALAAPVPRFLQDDLVLSGACQARLAGRSSAIEFMRVRPQAARIPFQQSGEQCRPVTGAPPR